MNFYVNIPKGAISNYPDVYGIRKIHKIYPDKAFEINVYGSLGCLHNNSDMGLKFYKGQSKQPVAFSDVLKHFNH